jgi:Uma2 family endonuclease
LRIWRGCITIGVGPGFWEARAIVLNQSNTTCDRLFKGGFDSRASFEITGQLANWVDSHLELGVGFAGSTCFQLPDGSYQIPSVSWISLDRWNALTLEQQEHFPPIAPDFVIELRSKTDDLAPLQTKLLEYIKMV